MRSKTFEAFREGAGLWCGRASGQLDSETRTIHVAEDGHGMDRPGGETFLRKFSPRSDGSWPARVVDARTGAKLDRGLRVTFLMEAGEVPVLRY